MHNPKVEGSNPSPATTVTSHHILRHSKAGRNAGFFVVGISNILCPKGIQTVPSIEAKNQK
jgi:hypothetical protein